MASAAQLRQQLDNSKRQKSFAWAKYYEQMANDAAQAGVIIRFVNPQNQPRENLPKHITDEMADMATQLRRQFTCPICLDIVSKETIAITWCGHIYCKECLEALKTRGEPENRKCGICRRKL